MTSSYIGRKNESGLLQRAMKLLLGGILLATQQIRHEQTTGCESMRIWSFYGRAFKAVGAYGASTKAGHIPFAMLFWCRKRLSFSIMRCEGGSRILHLTKRHVEGNAIWFYGKGMSEEDDYD